MEEIEMMEIGDNIPINRRPGMRSLLRFGGLKRLHYEDGTFCKCQRLVDMSCKTQC